MSYLGELDGTLPLHAYSIPYQFTYEEAQAWIGSQSDNIPLQGYLANPQLTPAGLMFPDGYSQILVWVDASSRTHVIDVTNMAVAKHINDASYESSDSSVVVNAYQEVKDLAEKLSSGVKTFLDSWPLLLAGYVAVLLIPPLIQQRR